MMLKNLSGMPNAFICQSVSFSMQGVKWFLEINEDDIEW